MYLRKRQPRARSAVAVAAVLVLLVAGVAQAASAEPGPYAEPSVVDELVFDPVEATVTIKAPTASADGVAADGTTCGEIHAWVTARSLWGAGSIVYRYHHVVGWCWDGDRITDIEEDRDWVTHVDSAYNWKGTRDWAKRYYRWGGNSKGRYRSYMQGWLQQCIHSDWGCLNYYPWITLNVYADGDSDYDGDAG